MAKTQNFLNWLNAPQQGQQPSKPMDAMDAALATPMPQAGADPMQAIQAMYQMDLLHGGGNRRRLNLDGSLQNPAAPQGLDYLDAYGPDRASVKARQVALDNIVTGKNSPVGRVADTPELQAWAAQQLANAPQEQGNVQQLGGGIQSLQTPYGNGYSQAAGSGYKAGQVIDPALGQPSANNGMTNAEQGRLAQDIMNAISYGYASDPLQTMSPSASQSNTNVAEIPNWSNTPQTGQVSPERVNELRAIYQSRHPQPLASKQVQNTRPINTTLNDLYSMYKDFSNPPSSPQATEIPLTANTSLDASPIIDFLSSLDEASGDRSNLAGLASAITKRLGPNYQSVPKPKILQPALQFPHSSGQ